MQAAGERNEGLGSAHAFLGAIADVRNVENEHWPVP